MKNTILLIAIICTSFASFAQNKTNQKLTKENDTLYVEYRDSLYKVDTRTLTLKVTNLSEFKTSHRILRRNKLNFIDIEVPNNIDIEDFVKQLSLNNNIVEIEYNSLGVYYDLAPNDQFIEDQWHIQAISLNQAWDVTTGSPDIIIGVLDSGTDWEHDDIGLGTDSYQNIYLNSGEDEWSSPNNPNSGNGIDDDGNGLIDDWKGWNYANNSNDTRTSNFHGTAVTGIVAAKTNNLIGVAGVAGGNNNLGAKILPYCIGVNQPDGSVLDDAIIDAVDNGARVIQLSLGVLYSSSIEAAIQYAHNNNVVIICASGNNYSSTINYPASNPYVISVGAIDENDNRASFSNYGTYLDLVAPGVNIYTTGLNNTYIGNNNDGTSFAAPLVSGVVALILSINPDLNNTQVRNFIESSTDKIDGYSFSTQKTNGTWNNEVGYGRVNAKKAVDLAVESLNFTGSSIVCSSNSTYTIDLPAGKSIIWSCSSNLQQISGNDTDEYIVKANGTGNGWVKANIEGTIITKNVWVGKPNITLVGDDYPLTPYEPGIVEVLYSGIMDPLSQSVTQVDWSYSGPLSSLNGDLYKAHFRAGRDDGMGYIYAEAYNQCGSMENRFFFEVIGDEFLLYGPNPADDELIISQTESTTQTGSYSVSTNQEANTPAENEAIYLILYDVNKIKIFEEELTSNRVIWNTSSLDNGIYYLHIFKNNKTYKKQIAIEHK